MSRHQKPPSRARGSWTNQHSNGVSWEKLLALAPGAERSRCERLVLLGHLWRCMRSVDSSDVPHPVSELTTCPRLGEDCWSRGLQSAYFWQVAGWRVVHAGASLVDGHRIAPPRAQGNQRLHALPWLPGRSRVEGLACPSPASEGLGQEMLHHLVERAVGSLRLAGDRLDHGLRQLEFQPLRKPSRIESKAWIWLAGLIRPRRAGS